MSNILTILEKFSASNILVVVFAISLGILAALYPQLGIDFPTIANSTLVYLGVSSGASQVMKVRSTKKK